MSVSLKRARVKARERKREREARACRNDTASAEKVSGRSEQDEQVELPTDTQAPAITWVAPHKLFTYTEWSVVLCFPGENHIPAP